MSGFKLGNGAPTLGPLPTFTPQVSPALDVDGEDSTAATGTEYLGGGTPEDKLKAKVKRQQVAIERLQDELDARKAGTYKGEMTTVRALREGIPDSVRTGVELPKAVDPLGEIEIGRDFSQDRLDPLEAEIRAEYCDANGKVKVEEFRGQSEKADGVVEQTKMQVHHDNILRDENVVERYSKMSTDDQEALLEDLSGRGDAASTSLATALKGGDATAIGEARKNYFYEQSKNGDNSKIRGVFQHTAAGLLAKYTGTPAVLGVPIEPTTLKALKDDRPEGAALAAALENPADVDAIQSAMDIYMESYIAQDSRVVAAIPADYANGSRATLTTDEQTAISQAEAEAHARAMIDPTLGSLYAKTAAQHYDSIHGQEAVPPATPNESFYEGIRAAGTPQARALATALEEHTSEAAIQEAMDEYAYSLGITQDDLKQTQAEAKQAKEKLKYAENLPKYLDRALDGRNQRLLTDMGLENLQFTDGEKAKGALNRFFLKPIKGVGVFASIGKSILDTISSFKSALQGLGIIAKDQEYKQFTMSEVGEGAKKFEAAKSDLGKTIADENKPAEDGGKAYADAGKAREEKKKAFQERAKEIMDEDRDERTVARHKALEGYKTTV